MNKTEAFELATLWRQYWSAGLRSGKYQQTIETLFRPEEDPVTRNPAGMCCLGVVCDLIPVVQWESVPTSTDPVNVRAARVIRPMFPMRDVTEAYSSGDSTSHLVSDSFLPDQVQRLLLISGNFQERLAGANDTRTPFEEIANILDNEHAAQMGEAWLTWENYFVPVTYDDMPKPPDVPKWEVTATP